MIKTIIVVTGLYLFTVGCGYSQPTIEQCKQIQQQLKTIPRYVSKRHYVSDSLYLTRVIRNCIDSAKGTTAYINLHESLPYKKYRDSVEIIIPELFYSPDSLKMFAFVVLHTPRKYFKVSLPGAPEEEKKMIDMYKKNPWDYEISTVVGFRNKPTDEWYLYTWARKKFVGLKKYEETIFYMGRYYLNLDMLKLSYIKQPIYTIDQIGFWNDVIFDKDNYVKGYYDFQISDQTPIENVATGIRDFSSLLNGIAYPTTNLGGLLSREERNAEMHPDTALRYFRLPYSQKDIDNLKKKIIPPTITFHRKR